MAAEEDSDDKTRVGAAPPPQPKLPTSRPADTKAADDESDHTQITSAPPPQPKLPTAPPPQPPPASETAADHTQIAGTAPRPPVAPKLPSTPPPATTAPKPVTPTAVPPPQAAAPPQAAPPPQAAAPRATAPQPADPQATRVHAVPRDETLADQTGEATVVITERVQVTMRLQRLQPAGRSEVIRLDRASYVLGRAHTCDIALFSPSASREHARLTNHEGEWYIEPLQNKSVLVNGSTVSEPTLVTHKMHIQLGADELLFLDDRAAAQASAAPTRHRRRTPLIATIAAVVAVLAAVAIWWFMHK